MLKKLQFIVMVLVLGAVTGCGGIDKQVEKLGGDNSADAEKALKAKGAKAVDALVAVIKDADAETKAKIAAANVLGEIGADALPALVEMETAATAAGVDGELKTALQAAGKKIAVGAGCMKGDDAPEADEE